MSASSDPGAPTSAYPAGPGYGPPPGQGHPPAPYGYGAPPQGWPGGWPQGPRSPKRPGVGTATGVIGIILGIYITLYAASALIVAATGTDALADNTADDHGALAIAWTVGVVGVVAGIAVFVGAIQLLSGSNVWVLRVGALLAVAAIWIAAVWALTTLDELFSGSDYNGQGKLTITVIAILLTIAPLLVLGLSLSPSISKWFTKKRAYRAAGMDD